MQAGLVCSLRGINATGHTGYPLSGFSSGWSTSGCREPRAPAPPSPAVRLGGGIYVASFVASDILHLHPAHSGPYRTPFLLPSLLFTTTLPYDMASTPNSETTTVVHDDHTVHPVYRPAGYTEGQELHNPRSHDENLPDISFPFITTDINRGGLTNEYRAFTKDGYVDADHALRPIPTHVSDIPGDLKDPEKAARLRDVKLVTWLPDDPEDPRNWSNTYKWCK